MNLATLIPARQFRYYYDSLSKVEAAVYHSLLAGLLQYESKIVCRGCTVSQVQKIFRFLTLDIPELFFVKTYKIQYFTGKKSLCTVIPEYRFSINQAHDTLVSMVQSCKGLVDKYKSASDFQKDKAIHDFIASTVKYKDVDAPYSHEAPGTILFQIGVCEGIAKAYKYLSDQLGLQSIVVLGSADNDDNGGSEGHAWNLVNVNGTFYHVDTTFDTTISTNCIRYDYFNLSDADMHSSHHWEGILPTCPKTFGLYEKAGCYFNSGKELASYIRNTSAKEKHLIFKLPKTFQKNDAIVDSIMQFIQSNIKCGLFEFRQYSLSYNLTQMVFQVDFI